ncbi:MAG: chitobiase/beta-hexosaminidase C-terminal domain-containing protein, partial [Muribaculaceae bacterium]|nr:chitobiase/beta-hexosaminidase C-terminal domain-containing protein [Muribaculaceae bacterium]
MTAESPLYTEPFRLDRNATIRAFALIPGLDIEPSDIVTHVVNSFKVKEPTGSFNAETRELTLSCETDNARIFYSFVADGDWTEYTGPISITRNRTVYAKATLEGWNDSEVTPIHVNELAESVPAPEISFNDGLVTISCDNNDAEIHYTVDDPNLTAESPLYTEPFRLDRNATIRA